ncbi:hypothetical protein TorRG33x02_149510 [Trema orientale]|uniref:Uncharacterized protein n=1 Tax=Trema orientale TaxID=63057 RepID=A0A2P5EUR2_TREOI|nr:hypothetical protein TorRG33x02_149510 [Trema orientale]
MNNNAPCRCGHSRGNAGANEPLTTGFDGFA